MEKQEKNIELYPGNWLFNASIIGFLTSLKKVEKKDINEYLAKDGRILLPKKLFRDLKIDERYFSEGKISSIVAKAPIYRNYLQPSEKTNYIHFVRALEKLENIGQCDISTEAYNLPVDINMQLRSKGLEKFLDRIIDFNMIFHADMGPSLKMFPNAYWNNKQSNKVSQFFAFLVIHQHLAFTQLSGLTKVFINAPSYKLMYELNKLINESFEWSRDHNNKSLLAMSVIEYCAKANSTLGLWAGMNIEIIAITRKLKEDGKYDDIIEYYSLPSDVIQLISNKRISTLLSEIGEFKVLNLVLNGDYNRLVEMAYRILKISMKSDINKGDKNFIRDNLFLSRNNYSNKTQRLVANKMLKLYALINERIKAN